jgi:hypothetical protein
MATLADVATQIRSKNAGPLRLTLDVFFDDAEVYERVVDGDVITAVTVADRYNIDEDDVLGIYELDRVTTIKITLRRPVPAGDVGDSDVYGTQQHGPLLDVEV